MTAPVARLPGNQCSVHRYHWPPVLETEVHHVWPLGMGGPDTAENRVACCPTGHSSIHVLIRSLMKAKPLPKATREEKRLAVKGFTAWVQAGRPGRIA